MYSNDEHETVQKSAQRKNTESRGLRVPFKAVLSSLLFSTRKFLDVCRKVHKGSMRTLGEANHK
jgi:hypothetical protein